MHANGQTIIQYMEQFAPKHLAMEGDKIGLQLGTLSKPVKKVLVTLDVLEEVVDEAIAQKADLIIAHHAIIYRQLSHLRTDQPAGRLYEKLIKNDIAVYVAHTNLDLAEGGINDLMATLLDLREVEVLEPLHTQALKKLVVFIPEEHAEQVMEAISEAGAGWIGNYSHCTFQLTGTGTFMPREGSDPFIGSRGKLEKVREVRLETIVPSDIQNRVVRAMLKAHPYEEVAYDLYPVDLPGKAWGLGRIGKLPQPISLKELAELVKSAFEVKGVRVVGPLEQQVQKIAVIGGDGNKFINRAIFAGADVLVTGDIYYHTAHDALAGGLSMIDPGHNAEKVMKRAVADMLKKKLEEGRYDTEVLVSSVDTDPFRFL